MILCFLMACAAFCAESNKVFVDASVFDVASGDRPVYVKPRGASYGVGSVWVRVHDDGAGSTVFYRPEEKKLYYAQDFSIDNGPQLQERHMKKLLQDVAQGCEDNPWEKVCARKYRAPVADITCAAVTALREISTGNILFDGAEHPEFHSWARYMPFKARFSRNYSGTKVVFSTYSYYDPGDMWIAAEGEKTILFYWPESGPDWMYYRYDLAQDEGWPKNCLPELETIRRFARSEERCFGKFYSGRQYDRAMRALDVARAVLSGRAARWDEPVWFAWRPQCHKNDPFLKVQRNDCLQTGRASRGVYKPGSVWITLWHGKKACRIFSQDGSAFQIAEARFPASSQELLRFAPEDGQIAIDFINGGQ